MKKRLLKKILKRPAMCEDWLPSGEPTKPITAESLQRCLENAVKSPDSGPSIRMISREHANYILKRLGVPLLLLLFLLVGCGSGNDPGQANEIPQGTPNLSSSETELLQGWLNLITDEGQSIEFKPCFTSLPIHIVFKGENKLPVEAWTVAMEFWHEALGVEAFTFEPPGENDYFVTVDFGEVGNSSDATCGHMDLNTDAVEAAAVIAHELGHNLGLFHSSNQNCIMYGNNPPGSSPDCNINSLREYIQTLTSATNP
jgi:matrixin